MFHRANAAKSTGPKTEKGKAKARLNALKHGGRARTTDVMPVLAARGPQAARGADRGLDRRLAAEERHRARAGSPRGAAVVDAGAGRAVRGGSPGPPRAAGRADRPGRRSPPGG